MSTWIRVLCGVAGIFLQVIVLDAAIRTFLLPRVADVTLSRVIAQVIRRLFNLVAGKKSYATKDRILSLYASITLLAYQTMWLGLSLVAFAFFYVASGTPSFSLAFNVSGSSLFSAATHRGAVSALGYIEAGIGLTLLALLIAFIGPLYQSFQRREFAVSRLTVRAGIPATPWGVLEIAQSVESYDRLDELWREWETWFIDVGETHTTLPILNFYRSPLPTQTWIGCAATVLDAAALFNAAVDAEPSPTAGLCIRAGWLTLRRMADYFRVPYPTTMSKEIPIAVSREDFEIVLKRLESVGVPILADHDAAWTDFLGWRVNYDAIIERFYTLFTCPRTDWKSAAVQPLFGPSNKRV
jgi:hypothetical protein